MVMKPADRPRAKFWAAMFKQGVVTGFVPEGGSRQ